MDKAAVPRFYLSKRLIPFSNDGLDTEVGLRDYSFRGANLVAS